MSQPALPSLPLLRTKLFPVAAGSQPQLERTALVERLLAARDRPLTILCTPAGYGKSTLLGQLRLRLQAAGVRVAWLSCDEVDGEPQRLLRYLVAAIAEQRPGFGGRTLALLQGEESLPHQELIDAFLVELAGIEGRQQLILDDVHHLRHPDLAPLARGLIERMPDHVRLIVSTRRTSGLIGERSMRGAAAFCFGAEDLCLTPEETRVYLCEIRGLRLSRAQVRLLHERTEGWITALHLATLSLGRCGESGVDLDGLTGTERNIADYLGEDVVDRLPGVVQRFLERTSVLEEFNAELCSALTGQEDAVAALQRLQREQLFIVALDERGEWFRYHPLFAEYLQGRLARHGEPTQLLHAAARWCEQRAQVDKSVTYALRARDYAFAADLLERQGVHLMAGNRLYDILATIGTIPAEVIRENPVFQIFYAWQLAFEEKYVDAEALLEDIAARLQKPCGREQGAGLSETLALVQVIKALVLLYQDKLGQCLTVTRHWLSLVPDGRVLIRASLSCLQAAAHALLGEFGAALGMIELARGSLRHCPSEYLHVMLSLIEALLCKEQGLLERGCALAEDARARVERVFGSRNRVGGPLALAYADLLYERDRHAGILAELLQATTWRDVATPIELISRGRLLMARASFFAGESEQALVQLDDWLTQVQGTGYERLYALAVSCKVQFLLWLRRPSEAERLCLQLRRHSLALPAQRDTDVGVALVQCQARLALSGRRGERVVAQLEAGLAKQGGEHRRDSRVRLSLLLAAAYWGAGSGERAFALFQATLEDAWGSGYRRAFLDDGLWLLPLWEAWRVADPEVAGRWQGLAEQMRMQCRRLGVDQEVFAGHQDVNPREQDILRLVAAGLSNREIAKAMHLSEATIKWHLHNLFAKLGTRSRTQAVLAGRRAGWLTED
ncbi:LuxR C-terminal-related transcriptional regulator [Pseudomonas benzenivorans]|uniref:LuxR C-terminal-related transcriptional regulator n=1 Tax=Pseudomonas benzenivorans TaxID=556533 RepID=UPI0035176ED1